MVVLLLICSVSFGSPLDKKLSLRDRCAGDKAETLLGEFEGR